MAKRLIYILIAFLAVSGFAATHGTLVDKRDGKKYKTVKIGDQTWMAENLNYDVDSSFCYNNRECNCAKYGRIYKWQAALKACPSGWRLPSKGEFEALFVAVGKEDVAGKKLKSTSGWKESEGKNNNGDDAFGFSALPAGYRYRGFFFDEGGSATFWSSTELGSDGAYYMGMVYYEDYAYLFGLSKNNGFSVRCLKDETDVSATEVTEASMTDSRDGQTYETDVSATEVIEEFMTDSRDGRIYKTVKIGTQTWMAKNLNYKANSSFCYNNEESNCAKYGRLYTWAAAVGKSEDACGFGHTCSLPSGNIQGICPDGWHLPSNGEFEALIEAAGSKYVAGMKLKSTSDWKENGNGDDAFGFSALPAGSRFDYGLCDGEGVSANFWSSSEDNSYRAYNIYLYYKHDRAGQYNYSKNGGLSVRCLKDSQ